MEKLNNEVREILETGHDIADYFDPSLTDEQFYEVLHKLWLLHGDEVTRGYIARHPGQRPWSWWEWDAPGPRPDAPSPNGGWLRNWDERDGLQRLFELGFLFGHKLVSAEEEEAIKAENEAMIRWANEVISSLKLNTPDPAEGVN
jgi:hypothetical protein